MDILEIKNQLAELNQKESKIDDDLETIIDTQSSIKQAKELLFKSSIPQLNDLQNKTDGLINIVLKTFKSAENIALKVRSLDKQKSRVSSSIQIYQNVIDMTLWSFVISSQLTKGNYLDCIPLFENYLKINTAQIQEIYNRTQTLDTKSEDFMGKSIVEEMDVLLEKAIELLVQDFDEAITNSNFKQIQELFPLFPKLNQHHLGINKYSYFLCKMISSKKYLEQFVESCTFIYENGAIMIDKQQEIVSKFYGDLYMQVLEKIADEIKVQIRLVLNSFIETKQIDRKVKEIQAGKSTAEARELDKIITEIALILNKTVLFNRFLETREIKREIALDTLQDYFIIITENYIQLSIQQAMLKKNILEENKSTRSVDDVFYILKTVLVRGGQTAPDCLCVLINQIGRILEEKYMGVLQKNLSNLFKDDQGISQAITVLNDLQLCCDYIIKLDADITSNLPRMFPYATELSLEKIKSCLSIITDFSKKYNSIVQTWIENYFKQAIKPKIKPIISTLLAKSYVINEFQQDSFGLSLENQLNPLFNTQFNDQNQQYLVKLVLEQVTKEIEIKIFQLKFNYIGALLFESQIKQMIQRFNNMREICSRLNQISILLSMEDKDEVKEYWNQKWKIKKTELGKILSLRVEFGNVVDPLKD
ncbi:Golgi transport complex subunit 4 [Boothiomyces sp. JEL0838]|nr:Golgi transport complex subunit 4 [Boothiomyces sp. JEL0838]